MPKLFNVYGFEPPHPVRGTSFCPWVDHSVSGLPPATSSPYSDSLSLRLHRSRGLALPQRSNSPVHYAKGTPSTRATRKWPSGLRLLVDTWFQVLLTPLIAVLFTFQSPYLFTIGRPGVLSLGGWAPRVHTKFHGIRATLGHLVNGELRPIRTGLSPAMVDLSRPFCLPCLCNSSEGPQPRSEDRFGLYPLSLAATNGVSVDFLSSRY